ncbi:MAG: tetratricopeptide repeat protein [Sulfuritalea sp.]|nr:tetratricopeptide repeat protein [Sulfuritalea sp.]
MTEKILLQALEHHRAGRMEEAVELYQSILKIDPNHAEANHNMGAMAVQVQQPVSALPYFMAALDADPSRGAYWTSYIDALFQAGELGAARDLLVLARQNGLQGKDVDALGERLEGKQSIGESSSVENGQAFESPLHERRHECFGGQESVNERAKWRDKKLRKSVDRDSESPDPEELNLLKALLDQGRFAEAGSFAEEMTARYPAHVAGWKAMSIVMKHLGRREDALNPARVAAALAPDDADACSNLGVALYDLGHMEEAQVNFRKAIEINPAFASAHRNLGLVLLYLARLGEAASCFWKALEIEPAFAEAHANLAAVLIKLGRYDEADASFRTAIAIKPDWAWAFLDFGNFLKNLGRLDEARSSYRRASQLGLSEALVKEAFMLPAIMGTRTEVLESRAKFEQSLHSLMSDQRVFNDPLTSTFGPNFYLAYHGLNDRDLQIKVAKYYEKACPSLRYIAPHCASSEASSKETIRVGFFSKFMYNHSVSLCFGKLISALSQKKRLQVSLISNRSIDEKHYSDFSGKFVYLTDDLDQARNVISGLELDILVYLDIGMEPMSYFLAFSRLAPVQCVMSGHPVTTGIANVDYFLSPGPQEPPNAAEHYSEKLIRLPRQSVCFSRPKHPARLKSRAELNLPVRQRLYMCPMALQKLHPDFDEAIDRILKIDSEGVVVFFEDSQWWWWKDALMKRFGRTISEDVLRRILFLPWLKDPGDFFSAIEAADVILDPFHFGIGSTVSITAAQGTPMVTKQGELLRGRVGAFYCELLGVEECIANDTEDYAQLAVNIASDRLLRETISTRIRNNSAALYDDMQPVDDLAGLFFSLVNTGNSPAISLAS